MSDFPPLTSGACDILSNITPRQETEVNLVVQLLSIQSMPSTTSEPATRYRVVLSDSVRFMPAMLAPELTDLLEPGTSQKNILVGLDSVLCKWIRTPSRLKGDGTMLYAPIQ
ncbi:hypothetical protein FB451DRAFT_1419309 [Mycena latifolia]|nr:hypothetical protein FB451DRAFT_1419309 [Mycena latifolia]